MKMDTERDLRYLGEIASAVKPALFGVAFETVRNRFGLNVKTPAVAEYRTSSERLFTQRTRRMVCGAVLEDNMFVLYAPGIAARASTGGDFRLIALNAFLHESTHLVPTEQSRLVRTTYLHGLPVRLFSNLRGMLTTLEFQFPETCGHPRMFNHIGYCFDEGMTESFAREWMWAYLELDPAFCDVTEALREEHRKHLAAGSRVSFYARPVAIMDTIAAILAEQIEDNQNVWSVLYQSLCDSTDLTTDRFFVEKFRVSGIEQTIRKLSGAIHDDAMESLHMQLRCALSVWGKLEATVEPA